MGNDVFAIGIPTINRADLLNPTLEKYLVDFPTTQIFIVDNGKQDILENENVTVTVAETNWGVSKSWNFLCNKIYEKWPYACILNDDIYLGKFEQEILDTISQNPDEDFLVATGSWCSFILPKKTWHQVGEFDENYHPAYFEDNDYCYRLKLAGISTYPTTGLAPTLFRNSQSIQKDSSLNLSFEANKQRYIAKWGGMPGQEVYQTAFNQPI